MDLFEPLFIVLYLCRNYENVLEILGPVHNQTNLALSGFESRYVEYLTPLCYLTFSSFFPELELGIYVALCCKTQEFLFNLYLNFTIPGSFSSAQIKQINK
ncbi:hypothetical protein BpHYR1_051451 [Brachionus plicatilis]|uniref:Uncharacterized protein n=1 Tax=Brachionus plicatilis TaxID=10195 RepID=A0A3M7QFV3_BRAPC|nr:hypothetical protein BpHYR1_051451 [Brachionus plicatilis]